MKAIRFVCVSVLLPLTLVTDVGATIQSPLSSPSRVVAGVDFDLVLSDTPEPAAEYTVTIERNGQNIASYNGSLPDTVAGVVLPGGGDYDVTVSAAGQTWTSSIRAIPGLFTILPPLLAILVALIFRQVVIALFAGVWLGAFIVLDYNLLRSFFYVVDHYVIGALAGGDGWSHVQIAVFTLLLGGMVGVFSRIGGTKGVVEKIATIATTPRRGQLATWLMGLAIFFDDYTNTVVVGNTMRPITDRLKISREKLAYIVDSTAAPVACIAIITSWIGFEVSLIGDAFRAAGVDRNPFTTFVASIPYSFYPILTLVFGFVIATTTRDFGPMLKAERRSRATGELLAPKAMPLSSMDEHPSVDMPNPRWFNAAIPIAVVVIGTFIGLVVTGRSSLLASGVGDFTALDVIRASDPFNALLWSSLSGCVVAIGLGLVQRLASLLDIMNAWVTGAKSMTPALVILVLAWCIGQVCTDLNTAGYLTANVSGIIEPSLLPTIVFLIAALVSFSTGTSWGTMTILTPVTIPLVLGIADLHGLPGTAENAILLSSISAILAGSVFGDHCSPISDTTILSSMASSSDHVDHVRTQLPYALVVALIAVVLGYFPSGFSVPPFMSLVVGGVVVFVVIRLVGRRERDYAGE
jgi:Na+/H+ antiporter NhaC